MGPADEAHLLLDVAGSEMALPMSAVAEILPVTRFERQAPWPRILAGFMNLRGEALAVIDLAGVLDPDRPAERPDLYSHVVRLKPSRTGAPLALLVDRASDIRSRAEGFSEIDEAASANGAVAGQLEFEGRLVPRLDPERLLLLQEELRVAELAQTLQARLHDSEGAGL